MSYSNILSMTLLLSVGMIVCLTHSALPRQEKDKMFFVEWLGIEQVKNMQIPQNARVLSEIAVLYSKPTFSSDRLKELKIFADLTITNLVKGDIFTCADIHHLHFNGCVIKSDIWAKVTALDKAYIGYTPIYGVAAFPEFGKKQVDFLQIFKRYSLRYVVDDWGIDVKTADLLFPSHRSLFDKIGFANLFPKLAVSKNEVIISFKDIVYFLKAYQGANNANIELIGCTQEDFMEDEYCYRTSRESRILIENPLVVFAFNDSDVEILKVKELISKGVFADEPDDLSPDWPLRYELSVNFNSSSVLLFATPDVADQIDTAKMKDRKFINS